MTTQEKQQIADALAIYCQRMGSQDKAANTLKMRCLGAFRHKLALQKKSG